MEEKLRNIHYNYLVGLKQWRKELKGSCIIHPNLKAILFRSIAIADAEIAKYTEDYPHQIEN